MFNKYFGNYILTKKIITTDQLKNVLSSQQSARVKLGILAIEAGYMTAAQVNEINKLQVQKDKRFGDLAIEEEILTESQLIELLNKQKTSQLMLGQILVDKKILSYEEYEKLLEDYKKDSGFKDQEIEILKNNNTDEIVNLFITMERTENVQLFSEYVELFIRNIVRFIDSQVIIQKPYTTENYEYQHCASQEITGTLPISSGLAGNEDALVRFASIYAEESLSTMGELAKDALGEFMNSQNGLFVSNLYHKDINYDLNPQTFNNNGSMVKKNQLFVLPCELSFGNVNILFNI